MITNKKLMDLKNTLKQVKGEDDTLIVQFTNLNSVKSFLNKLTERRLTLNQNPIESSIQLFSDEKDSDVRLKKMIKLQSLIRESNAKK